MTADARGRGAALAALAAIAALAFALRARGVTALTAGGGVALPLGDAPDHARRALWIAQHGPAPLAFDPLLAWPGGAWLPWEPLPAWLAGGLAWLLGGDAAAVERVALWLPPALGALATLPVYAAAARLAGRAAGLGAAALLAGAPLGIAATGAGQLGPPGLLALATATWLWAALRAAAPAPPGKTQIHVILARIATLLAAPAGGLRVAIADGAQLAVLARAGRRPALAGHALGLAASALSVLALLLALAPAGGREPWLLSLTLDVPGAGLAGALAAFRSAPLPAAGLGLALAGLVLAARAAGRAPAAPAAREPARVLALWLAGFGALALAQGRAEELAAPAAVAAAAGVAAAWRGQRRRRLARAGLAVATVAAASAVLTLPAWRAGTTLDGVGDPAALAAFADAVRAATPEPPDLDDPAYGILAPSALGPTLRWRARRAVAGPPPSRPWHDTELRPSSQPDSEAEALALAERAGARFVAAVAPEQGFLARLAAGDVAQPAERFRLVAVTPVGAGRAALFEVVAGAVIEAPAPPGTPVEARLVLDGPGGRRVQQATALA